MKKIVWVIALGCACGPQAASDDTGNADEGAMSTSTGMPTTDAPTTDAPTTNAPTTDTFTSSMEGDVETGVDEGTTIEPECSADLGVWPAECSTWLENCPCGTKCMPWANDGGVVWNDVKCAPLVRDPKGVGEPCTAQGSGVSGIDDCGPHSMCFGVDQDTMMGTCVAFCDGSEAEPSCADECSKCSVNGEGVLALCLPTCDPLVQDCPGAQGCVAIPDGFTCAPTGDNAIGEACEFVNDCAAGLFCASADYLPSCESPSCCTPFCDTATADGCAGGPDVTCVPWGETPACVTETIGICGVQR